MSELVSFRKLGYVHIPGVFPEELLKQVEAGAVVCGAAALPTTQRVFQPAGRALLHFEPLFADSRLVEFAREALSSKVKVSFLEYVQTPPEERQYDGKNIGHGWRDNTRLGIHRDGAWIDRDLQAGYPPMLTLKAAIWLSSIGPEDGHLRLWPGSHRLAGPNGLDAQEHADVHAQAGDVTWFDRRLFHSRTHNLGNKTRRAIFVEYSVTWIKRKQEFQVDADTLGLLSPTGIQLLQDPQDPWNCYWP